MKRRRNMSKGAKVAIAVTGAVLVPVALAGLGVFALVAGAKRVRKSMEEDLEPPTVNPPGG